MSNDAEARLSIQGWSGNEGDPWEDLGEPTTIKDWGGLERRYVIRQGEHGPLVVDVTHVEGEFVFHYHGDEVDKEEGHSHSAGHVPHGHPAYSDWRLEWLGMPTPVQCEECGELGSHSIICSLGGQP